MAYTGIDPPIHEIVFTPETILKIWLRHSVMQWEVNQVVFGPGRTARWETSGKHGGRVVVRGQTRSLHPRSLYVSLALVDPRAGVWRCITAFEPSRQEYRGKSR